jgi:hypothetical protein
MPWKTPLIRVADSIKMNWKRLLSYRKSEWELNDYPISLRFQKPLPGLPPRFVQHRYRALVLGWLIDGRGDSKQEALASLEQEFVRRKQMRIDSGESVPRPGTRVPLKFASQMEIERYGDLSQDFIARVLHPVLGIEDVWITDKSALWSFHFNETNDPLVAKIKEVYGVDVSDIESEALPAIFQRINESRLR